MAARSNDPREPQIPPGAWQDESWGDVAHGIARGTFWITTIGAIAYIGAVIAFIFM